jgi:hypothetical protein
MATLMADALGAFLADSRGGMAVYRRGSPHVCLWDRASAACLTPGQAKPTRSAVRDLPVTHEQVVAAIRRG